VDVDEAQTVEICKTALDRKQREALQIKSKYESKQKEVEFLRNRIEKLKGQINSLEKIHLEIQEKKKEVSSP
jgi:polyhydroxyalkanoate synthesis regulator phasin